MKKKLIHDENDQEFNDMSDGDMSNGMSKNSEHEKKPIINYAVLEKSEMFVENEGLALNVGIEINDAKDVNISHNGNLQDKEFFYENKDEELSKSVTEARDKNKLYQRIYENGFVRAIREKDQAIFFKLKKYFLKLIVAFHRGHTYVKLKNIEVKDILQYPKNIYQIKKLGDREQENTPLVLYGNKLTTRRLYSEEFSVAYILNQLAPKSDGVHYPQDLKSKDEKEIIGEIKTAIAAIPKNFCSYEQRRAVVLSLIKTFILITGGPGTGKTSSVVSILATLCRLYETLPSIALVAPTGKAAGNLSNSINSALNRWDDLPEEIKGHLRKVDGVTLHRYLQIYPPLYIAKRDMNSPLKEDIIVVDEASMMDLSVFKNLLFALRKNQRLILLGDINQLPAVGLGEILDVFGQMTFLNQQEKDFVEDVMSSYDDMKEECTDSDTIVTENMMNLKSYQSIINPLSHHIAVLTKSRRFDEDQGIGQLAKAILKGNVQNTIFITHSKDLFLNEHHAQSNRSYNYINESLFDVIYELQKPYWMAVKEDNLDKMFEEFYNVMVLTVLRQNSEEFNIRYLNYLREKGVIDKELIGVPYLINTNDAILKVSNGDICLTYKGGQMCFQNFDVKKTSEDESNPDNAVNQNIRYLPKSRLPDHSLAFSITTHKSQGSEYKNIHFIAPKFSRLDCQKEAMEVFNRALIYTAVTRAKEKFTFHGTFNSLENAVKNTNKRKSMLSTMLEELQNKEIE